MQFFSVTPVGVAVCVGVFYLLPKYLKIAYNDGNEDERCGAARRGVRVSGARVEAATAGRTQSNRRFWRMFVFALFLVSARAGMCLTAREVCMRACGLRVQIYPTVSSVVLRCALWGRASN